METTTMGYTYIYICIYLNIGTTIRIHSSIPSYFTKTPGRIQKLDPLYGPIITPISHMVLGDLIFRSLWGSG